MNDDREWVAEEPEKPYFRASFVLIVVVFGGICLFTTASGPLASVYNTTKVQCTSELALAKTQFEAAKLYKERVDKMLTEAQANHEAEKERFKTMIQSCFAMFQQSYFCQKHFNMIQARCNKIRTNYARAVKELNVLKNITRLG